MQSRSRAFVRSLAIPDRSFVLRSALALLVASSVLLLARSSFA